MRHNYQSGRVPTVTTTTATIYQSIGEREGRKLKHNHIAHNATDMHIIVSATFITIELLGTMGKQVSNGIRAHRVAPKCAGMPVNVDVAYSWSSFGESSFSQII